MIKRVITIIKDISPLIIAAIFDYNSHGTEWASRYDNLLPLVQFAITQLAYRSLPLKGDEPD